jgi:4-hydroxybenzoate polyprenyltransferase
MGLKRSIRWRDWALGRIPILATVGAYIAITTNGHDGRMLGDLLLFTFVFATSHAAFGFLINDLGDRDLDRRQAKPNAFVDLGAARGGLLLGVTLAVMLASGMRFASRPGFAAVWIAWLAAALGYSLPPLRLKERGAAGLAASTFAQWTAPTLLAFAAMGAWEGWEPWGVALVFTLSGVALEIAHQRHDRERDAHTSTPTFAVRSGPRAIEAIYACALWADRAAIGAVVAMAALALVGDARQARSGAAHAAFAAAALLVAVYAIALLRVTQRVLTRAAADPYYGPRTASDRVLHDMLPHLFVPTALLAWLTWKSPPFGAALAALLTWRLCLARIP